MHEILHKIRRNGKLSGLTSVSPKENNVQTSNFNYNESYIVLETRISPDHVFGFY